MLCPLPQESPLFSVCFLSSVASFPEWVIPTTEGGGLVYVMLCYVMLCFVCLFIVFRLPAYLSTGSFHGSAFSSLQSRRDVERLFHPYSHGIKGTADFEAGRELIIKTAYLVQK
jgi:hypothetical protein